MEEPFRALGAPGPQDTPQRWAVTIPRKQSNYQVHSEVSSFRGGLLKSYTDSDRARVLGSEAGSTQAGLPVLSWQWAAGTAPAWQPSLRTTLFPERRGEPETLPQVPSKHTWG